MRHPHGLGRPSPAASAVPRLFLLASRGGGPAVCARRSPPALAQGRLGKEHWWRAEVRHGPRAPILRIGADNGGGIVMTSPTGCGFLPVDLSPVDEGTSAGAGDTRSFQYWSGGQFSSKAIDAFEVTFQ